MHFCLYFVMSSLQHILTKKTINVDFSWNTWQICCFARVVCWSVLWPRLKMRFSQKVKHTPQRQEVVSFHDRNWMKMPNFPSWSITIYVKYFFTSWNWHLYGSFCFYSSRWWEGNLLSILVRQIIQPDSVDCRVNHVVNSWPNSLLFQSK